jgi:HK97 family phage prohead protease
MEKLDLAIQFETKAFGDGTGAFEGYASIFGNIDQGGDIVERGAFKDIVKGRDGRVKVLYQHNMRDPIGVAEVAQDDKGLKFTGQLILESASARGAYALMKGGALDGMSIGFDVLPGGAEIMKSGVRKLTALKLWEISPVTFGMNGLAGIDSVKSAGQITTEREFESFLRDAGFSKSQALQLVSGGWRALKGLRDAGDEEAAQKLIQQTTAMFRQSLLES